MKIWREFGEEEKFNVFCNTLKKLKNKYLISFETEVRLENFFRSIRGVEYTDGRLNYVHEVVERIKKQADLILNPPEETIKVIKAGLCAGRHEIPAVSWYVFGEIENPLDFAGMEKHVSSWMKEVGYFDELYLYVTGLTSSLIAVLNVVRNCEVVLYHYDRETGDYVPQKFFLTGQHARLSMETWGM